MAELGHDPKNGPSSVAVSSHFLGHDPKNKMVLKALASDPGH